VEGEFDWSEDVLVFLLLEGPDEDFTFLADGY
jgi:hypothetical protein